MSNNQYDNKQWGVADFKRYHAQQMTNEERHALEKAALDDPFLEDALDGYALATQPDQDLAYLQAAIREQQPDGKVIPFSYRPYRWLKIAAIIVLVAGLTWLMYPASQKDLPELAANSSTAPVTEQTPTQALQTAPATATPPTATASPRNDVTATEPPATPAPNYSKKDIAVNNNQLQPATRSSEEVFASKEMNDDVAKSAGVQNKMNAVAANEIKGRVVDNQGAPVPYATISIPQNNVKVATDVNGEFSVSNSQQNNVTASVNAPGFETAQAPLNAGNTENRIVLQENSQTMAEVVTTGYGQSRKKTSAAASISQVAFPERIKLSNVKLLRENAQTIDSVKKLITTLPAVDKSGDVVIRFFVGRLGNATNIDVVKPLCGSCDAAAVKLLQLMPPLRRVGLSKPEIRVHF